MRGEPSILERREFALLRHMDVDELRRITNNAGARGNPYDCPLARATGHTIDSPDVAAKVLAHSADEEDALLPLASAFLNAWDGDTMRRADLAAAVHAALAEKEAGGPHAE